MQYKKFFNTFLQFNIEMHPKKNSHPPPREILLVSWCHHEKSPGLLDSPRGAPGENSQYWTFMTLREELAAAGHS